VECPNKPPSPKEKEISSDPVGGKPGTAKLWVVNPQKRGFPSFAVAV